MTFEVVAGGAAGGESTFPDWIPADAGELQKAVQAIVQCLPVWTLVHIRSGETLARGASENGWVGMAGYRLAGEEFPATSGLPARRVPVRAVRSQAGLLALAGQAGNRAVAGLISRVQQADVPAGDSVQRCGSDMSCGCGERDSAETEATAQRVVKVQRQVRVEEPAGGCGICASAANTGTRAHQLLQSAFMSQVGGAAAVEATRRQLTGSPTDENFRLDLMIARPDSGFDIGEIKPANAAGFAAGETDLLFYANMLTTQVMRGAKVGRLKIPIQPSSSPGALVPIDVLDEVTPVCGQMRQLLFVNRPVNGIYGYFCQPTGNSLRGGGDCCKGSTEPVPEVIQIGVLTLMVLLLMLLGRGIGPKPSPVPPPVPVPPPLPPLPVPGFTLGLISPPVACPVEEQTTDQAVLPVPPADLATAAEQAPSAGGPGAPTTGNDQIPQLQTQVRSLLAALTPPVPGLNTLASLAEQLGQGPFPDEVMGTIGTLRARNSTTCLVTPTHPVIRQGSRGPDVAEAQRKLNIAGAAPPLVEDGIFGRLTLRTVIQFQQSHDLAADGIVGARTWAQLDQVTLSPAF